MVVDNIQQLDRMIDDLKKKVPRLVSVNDQVRNPGEGHYRSVHIQFIDHDGNEKELQLRTAHQDIHSEWMHLVYKPETPYQEHIVETHGSVLWKYAEDMSDYFYAVDKGQTATKPPCPDTVRQSIGCL